MTHLPFVAASYVLGMGVPLVLGVMAWQRLALVRRRLAAVDTRPRPGGVRR